MDLSFVILTWNSEKYIGKCLDSLIGYLDNTNFSYEIFIVDNGSNDRTVSIIQSFKIKYPDYIIPIYLKTNTGTTYSRNIALKMAKGRCICIMDSDVEILGGTIPHLVRALECDKRTGLIAPKLVYSNGSLQKSTDVFPTIITKVFRYFFLKSIEKRENKLKKLPKVQKVDYAISAMWVMKNEVLKNVGLLDENIFYAPEDVDYCLRLWLSGYRVVYDTRISAIHHAQELSRGLKLNKAMLSHIKGLLYYFWKHRYVFRPPIRTDKQDQIV